MASPQPPCSNLLGPDYSIFDADGRLQPWISEGGVTLFNGPLEQLLETAMAHVRVPPHLLEHFAQSPSGRWSAYTEVSDYLLEELGRALPDYEFRLSSLTVGEYSAALRNLNRVLNWTREDQPLGADPEVVRIHMDWILPSANYPPTVVKPDGGPLAGQGVQGSPDHFTLFIADRAYQSQPIFREEAEQPSHLLSSDFEMRKFVPSEHVVTTLRRAHLDHFLRDLRSDVEMEIQLVPEDRANQAALENSVQRDQYLWWKRWMDRYYSPSQVASMVEAIPYLIQSMGYRMELLKKAGIEILRPSDSNSVIFGGLRIRGNIKKIARFLDLQAGVIVIDPTFTPPSLPLGARPPEGDTP